MASPYDPTEYWLARGKTYSKEGRFNRLEMKLQEQFLIRSLQPLSFSSVLEVGCGFGRITKLLLDNFAIQTYDAFDLSPDQIKHAQEYVKNPKVNFSVSSIQSFEGSKKYDLVIASEVLLHVKPEDIKAVIGKLLSLSSYYFVHIDWDEDKVFSRLAETYNFMHNYNAIYRELGVQYTKTRIRDKQSFFRTVDARQSIFIVGR